MVTSSELTPRCNPATILHHITFILLSWPCWANANCHISPPHACSAALWTWWHHTIGESEPQPADSTWDVDWVRAASATSKPFWSSWIRPPKTRMKGSMLECHRFLKVCLFTSRVSTAIFKEIGILWMTEVSTVSLDKESQNVGPQTLGQLQSYRFLLVFCCFWAAIPETLRMLKVCWYFLPGHHASVWLGSRLTKQAILPTVNGHCVFCRLQWRNMPELWDFTGSQTLTQQPATANNIIYTMINYHIYWYNV